MLIAATEARKASFAEETRSIVTEDSAIESALEMRIDGVAAHITHAL